MPIDLPSILLPVHAAATWAMVGLIWFVQVVHYPLFARVGDAGYATYQSTHQRLTTLVVGPLMLVEAACAAWIVIARPITISPTLAWTGLALLVLIWLSTVCLQVPCHNRLARGFDARFHRRLVRTNWIRTLAWSARGVIALFMLRISVDA